ncbi:MAG: ATP-binding protein [Thermoplasmata archaeon]
MGEENGKIRLVSKTGTSGILPKGSFLTVENQDSGAKFILRVDETRQIEPYSPSPLIVDMDLEPLKQDQVCQNVVTAYRVKDISTRTDGLIDFIPPQSLARKSTQEEVDAALGSREKGPPVFIAAIHSSQNHLIKDDSGKPIFTRLPEEIFFHQIMVCGKTGSGKTVATKYLAQYFVEQMHGAVLAINVKDVDFLKMDKPSVTKNPDVLMEWAHLGISPKGIDNYTIYYPATIPIDSSQGVSPEVCRKVTLDVRSIDPESLAGLLLGITDAAAQSLPSIFRYWQKTYGERKDSSFGEFVSYFSAKADDDRVFDTITARGDESSVTLHKGTCENILRNLHYAIDFFDNEDAVCLDWTDVLVPTKMSVINVAGKGGSQFGSILLRDLLHKIIMAKDNQLSRVKVLIIIDEVHQFYSTEATREALGDLDTICRTGRSKEIGVVFSSQNPSDMPKGLASVVNTKIFFKTDAASAKTLGVRISEEEMESLRAGFAVATIHDMSQLKVLKFPMARAGVFEVGR